MLFDIAGFPPAFTIRRTFPCELLSNLRHREACCGMRPGGQVFSSLRNKRLWSSISDDSLYKLTWSQKVAARQTDSQLTK